jgi:hypothetical protein
MKRVFLSFAYEDIQRVKRLLPLMANPNYEIDFYDGALDIDIDAEPAVRIKRTIGEKIIRCNITVCLIGKDTYKSRWVACELEKSRNKGNKIIAMALKGVDCAALPELIREENLKFYPWNPGKLAGLIEEK